MNARVTSVICLVVLAAAGGGGAAGAASCSASARFVKGEKLDAKGFRQAATLAVAPRYAGPCHGLITYSLSWKDKSGAVQNTHGKTVKYTFAPGQGTSSSAATGAAGQGTRVTDDTVLEASACDPATPCRVTGATIAEVSCYKDGGGRCTAGATYSDATPGDTKGFKQQVSFAVSSADGGSACHGLVKYTLSWVDRTGAARTSSKSVSFKNLAGGAAASEILIVDETVLSGGACSDGSPCGVVGGSVEEVSCYLDK